MNEFFQSNKRSIMLLLSLFAILLIVLYFILLSPLNNNLASKERAVDAKQIEFSELSREIAKVKDESNKINIDLLLLEKTIPNNKAIDKYILSLEKLEALTNTRIEDISVVYDSSIDVLEEEIDEEESEKDSENNVDEAETNESANEETESNHTDTEVEEKETELENKVIITERPENLHVITFSASILSPNYDELINFIEAIEREERVSIVTKLEYTGISEINQLLFEDSDRLIPFDIELTTFYYDE